MSRSVQQLTTRSGVVLGTLTVPQLVTKFLAFVTPECLLLCLQQFVTCSYPEPYGFSPRPSIPPQWCILILFSHLLLHLSSSLFPSYFPNKLLYAFLFSPIRSTRPGPSHLLWYERYVYYVPTFDSSSKRTQIFSSRHPGHSLEIAPSRQQAVNKLRNLKFSQLCSLEFRSSAK